MKAKQKSSLLYPLVSFLWEAEGALLRLRLVTASPKAASRMRSRAELLTLCLQLRAKRSQARRATVANGSEAKVERPFPLRRAMHLPCAWLHFVCYY